jgi:hypothetical protein
MHLNNGIGSSSTILTGANVIVIVPSEYPIYGLYEIHSSNQFIHVVTIKIANTIGEMKDAIFANGFGRITDLEIGPDGYMYVLSSEDDGAILYKISQAS